MEYHRHWLKPDLPYDAIRITPTGLTFLKKDDVCGFYVWGDIQSVTLQKFFYSTTYDTRYKEELFIKVNSNISYRIKIGGFVQDIADSRNFVKELASFIPITEAPTNNFRWIIECALVFLAVIAVSLIYVFLFLN